MAQGLPLLIAGCGIGGMAAALALAKAGREVHIFERHNEPGEAGAGIQIGPNGVKALRKLGIADALEPLAGRPDAIGIYRAKSGRQLTRLPLGQWIEARHGAPYWTLHRRDLFRALLQAVREEPAIRVVTGFVVAGVTTETEGVRIAAKDDRTAQGCALIGADGIFSAVRRRVFSHPAPMFAGKTAARAVLPIAAAAEVFRTNETGVWLSPRAHLVHYPVRGGAEIAFIVVIDEDWQGKGWSAPVDRERLLAGLSGFATVVRDALGPIPEWRKWALFRAEPMANWSTGRVTLLGDAAHPLLPFFAQGAALALEDAVALGEAVKVVGADLDLAFGSYATARAERARRVMAASAANGRIYHLSGPAAWARDLVLRRTPPKRLMARYDWLYGAAG